MPIMTSPATTLGFVGRHAPTASANNSVFELKFLDICFNVDPNQEHAGLSASCQLATARIPVSASLSWQEMKRRELILMLVVSNSPVVTWSL